VTASDGWSGLAAVPAVTVLDSASNPLSVSYVDESPEGTFNYVATVTSATANGTATIDAEVSDRAGNTSSASQQSFTINKNQNTG
jgi:hypothetical protein